MNPFAALMGGLAIVFAVLAIASVILPALALAYVALRVQDTRRSEPDPRLGMKTAFHTVHSFAIILILVGLSVFMVDLMQGAIGGKPNVNAPQNPFGGPPPAARRGGDGFNVAQRTAVGLVGSGILFSVSFWAFLLGTNDSTHRQVRRVFSGGRMALCLLVTMMTVTGLLVVLLQKAPDDEATESLLAMLLVWFPAACVHMILFFANMRESPRKRGRGGDEEDRGWRPADDR